MMKKIGLLVAGLVGLYALEACVIVEVDCTQTPNDPSCTNNNGGSGSSDTSSVGVGANGGAGGAGGGMNTGGGGAGGGAATCDRCGDYVSTLGNGMTPNAICADGIKFPDNTTSESTTLLKALNDCTCDMTAGCGADCTGSLYCTAGGMAGSDACKACIPNKCKDPLSACSMDFAP